jgi:tetratricopeptide (TPR) repeat protein
VARTHSAIALLRQALELDPDYAQAHATLGIAYSVLVRRENRSWADSAQAASRRAIELAPDLAVGHVALGIAQRMQGLSGEALASFRQAIELDPNNADALQEAAGVLGSMGRYDEAMEFLLRGVRADPGDPNTYAWVASVYQKLGLPELAEAWWAEAERRGADRASIHVDRSFWAFDQGDLDRAEAESREAAALAPGRDDVNEAAKWVALARGRYEEARRIIEVHNREQAFEYATLIIPGYIAWKTGNEERAEDFFREGERRSREGISESPEVTEFYVDMARITSIRGDLDAAVSWMEKAYEHGRREPGFLRHDPLLENVRADPRFDRIVERTEADVVAMRERAPKETP